MTFNDIRRHLLSTNTRAPRTRNISRAEDRPTPRAPLRPNAECRAASSHHHLQELEKLQLRPHQVKSTLLARVGRM